jgi:hypothetical protein
VLDGGNDATFGSDDRSQGGIDDLVKMGRNQGRIGEVDAFEFDTMIGVGRFNGEVDPFSGMNPQS